MVLTGTVLTAACFVAFGFCKTFTQAIIVQVLMGLANGNQGIISTCLGEITDRSNQSRAFTYLPIVYGIGGITGPFIGGLLVSKDVNSSPKNLYPYLRPNLVSAGVLMVDLILTMFFLEESLEEAKGLPPLGRRASSLFAWVWQFASSRRPSYLKLPIKRRNSPAEGDTLMEEDENSESDDASLPKLVPEQTKTFRPRDVLNRDTLLLLISYGVFQFANISYNSLYPIFGQAAPPLGRGLSPKEIGVSLAFAGAASILVQVGIFGRLRDKIGNRMTYRSCLAGMVLAYMLTPWVGYEHARDGPGGISYGKMLLYFELGVVLLIRAMAAVGCLTSALLLVRSPGISVAQCSQFQITNSAPNHSVLGTLNGLAQTLSAAGRAAGPFLSGGLFSLAMHVRPKGEVLAFGVFGGIAFIGFLMSFGIRDQSLEAEGWDEEEGSNGDEDEDDNDGSVR